MPRRPAILFAMAGALLAAPAFAQTPPPPCPASPAPLPAGLAGWAEKAPLTAAAAQSGIDSATLQIGKAVDLQLRPTPEVTYLLRPEKPGGSVSHGGIAGFTVTEAGTYRVALGSGAWIDVVKDGKALESSGHGHGPACTGVRKMVDFKLAPGAYALQIAGNGMPALAVMVTRLP